MKIFFKTCFVVLLLLLNTIIYSQSVTTSTLYATSDAFVDNQATTTNYGSSSYSYLEIGVKVSGVTTVRRSFVQYDLSAIPSNAVIVSATLKFNKNSEGTDVTNSSFVVQHVNASWGETTITWANQASSETSDAITATTSNSTQRLVDVTSHVAGMVSGVIVNNGWIVKRNNETTATLGSTYKSRHVATQTDRPILEVQYYLPFRVSAATITHATNNAADGSIAATVVDGPSTPTYQWYTSAGAAISGATSATLSGQTYGWYGLKISGNQGVPVYMAFIIGGKCKNLTITFDPGPDYIDDAPIATNTSLGSTLNVTNFGSSVSFLDQKGSTGTVTEYKTLVRFRLWMDAGITLNKADLSLKGSAHITGGTNASSLIKVTSNWDENNVTWFNKPSTSTSIQENISATTTTTENRIVNTVNFWNNWKTDNPNLNKGMLFQLQNASPTSTIKMHFHSSDATTTTNRPSIDFQFTIAGSVTLPGTATPVNSSICSGSTTTINLTGYSAGATFQWESRVGAASFATISGATAASYTTLSSTIVTTDYRCVVTSGICSSVNSNTVTITIIPVPTVSVNSTSFCSGTNVTLTATPSIGGGTYLWGTGERTSTITVAPLTTTNFTVVYTLNGCASPVGTGTVTVCGFSTQYNDTTELGQISVDIVPVSGKVGPYHYQISTLPIENFSTVYHSLNDSIYANTLDSTTYFRGSVSATNFTYTNLSMGKYFVAVYDSRGKIIYERSAILIPPLTFSFNTNFAVSGNVVTSTGSSASGALNLYCNNGTKGESGFVVVDKSKTQFMGLILSDGTNANSVSNYKFGFSIKSNLLYLIENGVEGTTSYSLNNGSELKLIQVDTLIEFYRDGVSLKTSALQSDYSYKIGFYTALSGVQIQLLPLKLTTHKFYFNIKNIHHFSCAGQQGGFNFKVMNVLNISGINFTWSVLKDGVQVGSGTTNSPVYTFDPTSFGPGVYTLNGSSVYSSVTYTYSALVYIGNETLWEDLISYDNVLPNTYSLERTSANAGSYSNGRADNILAPDQIGWIQFNPILGNSLTSNNVLRLSTLNASSTTPLNPEPLYVRVYKTVLGTKKICWSLTTVSAMTTPLMSVPVNIPNNALVTIQIGLTSFDIYVNGSMIGSMPRAASTSVLLRAHSLKQGHGFDNIVTSFDCAPKQPLSKLSHAELKRSLDGGYTLAVEGKVKFTFDEEYKIPTTKFLPIKIYDDNHVLLVQSDLLGNITNENGTTSTEIAAISYSFDDNRYTLPVSSIIGMTPNAFYTIEVTTSTNETRYLKFQFKY